MAQLTNGLRMQSLVSLGNWLKSEYRPDLGICRVKATSLNTARADADTTMQVGDIVYQNDKTGDWLAYAADYSAADDNIGVVADETIYDIPALATEGVITDTVQGIAIIVGNKAPVVARKGGLFADAAVFEAAVSALEADGFTIAKSLA